MVLFEEVNESSLKKISKLILLQKFLEMFQEIVSFREISYIEKK